MLPFKLCWLGVLLVASNVVAADITIGDRDTAGLVRALASAARPADPVRITLAPGGLYTLNETALAQHGLQIAGRIELIGNGAEIRRYTRGPMTLLEIAASADVTIDNLTLAEGNLGAIRNHGRLTLRRVVISDCTGEQARGIVLNHGRLHAEDVQVIWNRVEAGGRDVGTLINHGTMTLQRTKIAHNSVSRRYPSLVAAGAVLNDGRLRLIDTQVDDNSIADAFDAALQSSGVVNLQGGELEIERVPALPIVHEVLAGRSCVDCRAGLGL